MAPESAHPAPDVSQEDLVAYLDGELDDASSRRIEGLLVSDPKVRQTLQDLEKTWDLLDELDATDMDDKFTRSTLEMVAVAAAEEVQSTRRPGPSRRWPQWVAGLLVAVAASAAGFAAVTLFWPNPARQLAEDLPLLENLDAYRQIDDFAFLKRLHEESLFSEGEEAAEIQPAATSAAQKPDLLQAAQRLEALDPAERQRLRRLNQEINEDPDAGRLRRVMQGYHAWLRDLPMYRRAEVVELAAEERIAAIKRLIQEEEERSLRMPSPEDAAGLLAWMKDYALAHEAEVLATFPPERHAELMSNDEHRLRLVMSVLWMRPSGKRGKLPAPDEKDLEDALARLSPETRKKLAARPPREQWKLVSSWARFLVHYQGDLKPGGWMTPEVSEAELLHFFEFELTAEQRDALLALPGDEMQRQLRRLYFRIKLPRPDFGAGERPDERPWPPWGSGGKRTSSRSPGF